MMGSERTRRSWPPSSITDTPVREEDPGATTRHRRKLSPSVDQTTTTTSLAIATDAHGDDTTTTNAMSPQMELRIRLLPRIASLRLKGYITSSQERHFLDVLARAAYNPDKFDSDETAVNVKRELDDIQRRRHAEESTAGSNTQEGGRRWKRRGVVGEEGGGGVGETAEQRDDPTRAAWKPRTVSSNDDEASPGGKDDGDTVVVVEIVPLNSSPSFPLTRDGRDVQPARVKELFVQMAFFARLGYVQPPSCLQCAHARASRRSRHNGRRPCPNWTVWRVDGKTPLQADEALANNLVLVSCSAAERLLRGELISGAAIGGDEGGKWRQRRGNNSAFVTKWKWDAVMKRLIDVSPPG